MRNESVHSIVHTITVTEFQSVTQMAILARLGKCICSYMKVVVSGRYGGLLTRSKRHGIVGRLAGRRPPGRVHRRHFEAVRGEGPQAVHRERGGVVLGGGAADPL